MDMMCEPQLSYIRYSIVYRHMTDSAEMWFSR